MRRLLAFSGLLLVACSQEKLAQEPHASDAPELGATVERSPAGEVVVRLDPEARERVGIQVAALEAARVLSELEVYGRVVRDPANEFVVRAPIAGDLHSEAWPGPGERVSPDEFSATISPRLSAAERADLGVREVEARGEAEALRSELELATTNRDRIVQLHAADLNASQREVDEAEALVRTTGTKVRAAEQRANSLADVLGGSSLASSAVKLALPSNGEVVGVRASVGEAVDAGATLLELVGDALPLVEVTLPIGAVLTPQRARVTSAADPERSLEATLVQRVNDDGGPARVRYRVADSAPRTLHVGDPVTAWMPREAAPLDGVALASSSILRVGGKTWVWIEQSDGAFARTEVRSLIARPGGWLAPDTQLVGQRVVVAGAQELLSFEILGAQSVTEEEE